MTKGILQITSLIISLGLSFVNHENYQPERELALEAVNWDAYQYIMSEEEYLALQEYLPVLTNDSSFIWQAGSLQWMDIYGDEPQQTVTLEEFRYDLFSGWSKDMTHEPLVIYAAALSDLDDDGFNEMIVYFNYTGGHYLVLSKKGDTFYGTDKYIRGFQSLQTNGVYCGSGGSGHTYYFQYGFENSRFTETFLGKTDYKSFPDFPELSECYYYIGDKQVDQETFEAWEASVIVGDVKFYKPSR